MKQIVFIVFLMVCSMSFGQENTWRDEISSARDAYKKGDYTKALRHYESAQKTVPDNIDLSDEMGQTAYKAREFERAEKIYQQGASTADNPQKKSSRLHNLGNTRMKQENYQGAIDAYKDALRKNPSDEKTRYNLSEAIRKLKDQQKKNPPPPPQEQQQNQQNQNNQNNQNSQGNQSQNQQGQQSQSGQNQSSKEGNGGNDSKNGSGQLPNKMVERELDKLALKEAETKRRIGGGNGAGKSSNSGKDW